MPENVVVKDLIKEISENLSQSNSSSKDEVRIMQVMLSDTSYEVSVYGKDGVTSYNPAKDFQSMCAKIIANVAKIPSTEAVNLMDGYNVRKSEAATMVNLSKEFVNTFLETGRKLPLGGREKSDIALRKKEIPAGTRYYPRKIGVNDDGSDRYSKTPTEVPAHNSISVYAPCPSWLDK